MPDWRQCLVHEVPAQMKTPLRILHLEDDPLDAELVKSSFRQKVLSRKYSELKLEMNLQQQSSVVDLM